MILLNISQYQNGTSPSVGQPCLATHSGYGCLRLKSIEIDYMEYGQRLASAFANSKSVPRHQRCHLLEQIMVGNGHAQVHDLLQRF